MFVSVIHFLNILIFLDITFAILCCILIIKLPIRYALKYVLIPLILSITYMSVITFPNMLGRPYEGVPVGEFEFKDYRVTIVSDIKKIELWVIQDHKSRLYLIDYSDIVDQALAKSKSGLKQGHRQTGKFIQSGDLKDNELEMSDVPLQQILPPKGD